MTTIEETSAAAGDPAERFGARMLGIVNDAAIALLVSIGHQTGLFDTMAELPAATSAQIADAAGLDERYVREWLGGLVSAGIIDYHPARATYELPRAHTAALTRAGGAANIARLAQNIAIFGEVEQKIIGCFRQGGGLPYTEFPRFHAIMAEVSGGVFDAALVGGILPLVDGLPERLQAGIDVADIGCGGGHAINLMARAFPASRFTGYDFSGPAIEDARAEAAALGLGNAGFARQDVAALDVVEAFDAITVFDAIHDQADPARVLANIHRALRPGGVLLMVDIKASSNLEDNIEIPWASWFYTASAMHCMTVSLSEGGAGLGAMWGRQLATAMLAEAGFGQVQVREVDTDPFNNYYVAHK
ncbi:MAG: class I SAM-dependent methyltransferase [Actinobacteria bacterium]|nr:class I SAM-dependent methyltransferase [Actinomycetota bacterium]